MKIVVASNSFKGSLTTGQAGEAIRKGILNAFPKAEIVVIPVADGGDGLLDVAQNIFNATRQHVTVTGPDFSLVNTEYCWAPSRCLAAVEMALASGLAILPEDKRNPTQTTTLGTGELIKAALDKGAKQILVGIGGSATNDGGIGAAQALGVRFLNAEAQEIAPIGENLSQINRIDISKRDPRLNNVHLAVACDVDNLLTGANGASKVYGPQKGATPKQVEQLEQGLENLALCIYKDLGINVLHLAGGGAAGGLGAGLHAFCGGKLQPGTELILDLAQLDKKLANTDLVITGEGQIDFQTIYGKAPAGVAARAKKLGIPCIALAGSIGKNINSLHEHGLTAIFTLCSGPISLSKAIEQSPTLLSQASEQVVRCFFSNKVS